MLHLASIADADEPVATVAPAPVLDKAAIDRREINRRAVKYWQSTIHSMIFDWHGRPLGLSRINPNFKPNPEGYVRYGERKLTEFSGLDHRENADGSGPGAWYSRASGASGHDVISLIEHYGECDRKTATTFLKELTDRCVVIAK
jgi:hypothetical protein